MEKHLEGYTASTKHPLLTPRIADDISKFFPERMQLRPDWTLKYSLEQHGASLKTLYTHAHPQLGDRQQRGYVLIIKDAKHGVFGAYTSEPLRPTDGRYRGNSDCFLWKLQSDASIKQFPYAGTNDFIVFCTPHFISFGGGDGHYGLWVDDSLDKGVTYPSLTFNNEVLSAQGSKFDVIGLEVWEI